VIYTSDSLDQHKRRSRPGESGSPEPDGAALAILLPAVAPVRWVANGFGKTCERNSGSPPLVVSGQNEVGVDETVLIPLYDRKGSMPAAVIIIAILTPCSMACFEKQGKRQ